MKNDGKQMKHAETAAIGGHPGARILLSKLEMKKWNNDRAIKHLVIAAKQGAEHAIELLEGFYANGHGTVSREVLDEALRGYQKALDAMKSPQREEADKAIRLGFDGF